jgi:hypothetical protein
MTALTEFLFPSPAERHTTAILRWWEGRRLHYNMIVGASGVVSLGVITFLSWLPPQPRGMPFPLPVIVVFGVLANFCYLLGPVVELGIEKLWGRKVLPAGPTLFRMGLTLSVGLTLLPTVIAGIDWLFRIVRWVI